MTARTVARKAMTWGIVGLGALAAAALTSGVASADINETAPSPGVQSRQASTSNYVGVRNSDYGVARGQSETRLADAGVIEAQGEVRDSTKAVPGSRATGFGGAYPVGPGQGDW